ncbi:MAG: GHKL domain-containing protein [Lachnospiraceae bacterium]|nr:GHKL domain-containing protein [Lachnospiraceae bacterium]
MATVSCGYNNMDEGTSEIIGIKKATLEYGDIKEEVKLPKKLRGMSRYDTASLSFMVPEKSGNKLYVKSFFSNLKIYCDNELIDELGKDGTYPGYMKFPPPEAKMITIPEKCRGKKLILQYNTNNAGVLHIDKPVISGTAGVRKNILEEYGVIFLTALFLMMAGFIFVFRAIAILPFERIGIIYLWMGLFYMLVGTWSFGKNVITFFLVRNASMLYVITFWSRYALMIPLCCFIIAVIKMRHEKYIKTALGVFVIFLFIASMLQLTGTVMFWELLTAFNIIGITGIAALLIEVYLQWRESRSITAMLLMIAVSVLMVSDITEFLNMRYHLFEAHIGFLQFGAVFFYFMMGAISSIYFRDSITIRGEERRKTRMLELMRIRVEQDKRHYESVARSADLIKRQRHDLRHQLMAMRDLAEDRNRDKLLEYLDELIDATKIKSDEIYCENRAVNAIVQHGVYVGEKNGIEMSVKLVVPESSETISDSELVVVFGNMIENAVEACKRMSSGKRFITIRSVEQYGTLVITMDNSYNGKILLKDGNYISSKRNEVGTGLGSVKSVAREHGGNASFEHSNDGIFRSSVYLRIS